ncbi:hypothetical protein GCM10011380_00520 [Sphingomonas metalli]|uniref:Phage head morphogenesis domain-containing protein n=1 Tax=Sphingomonas metalli TaxID=1779358 RepID=A0A916WM21_9SPHN|nr:phage minor head protein [Sphingomonas metalli]GGB15002.1 hypothetical protein GCM10011380_00520 [Sphingomonas metalli]
MRYDLPALARRAKNPRRRSVTLRDIIPPAVLATDLYRAAYAPVIALWSRMAERIIAEYERSLSALTTDAPIDLQRLLDEADGELQRLLILLTAAMNDWTVRVEGWTRGKWRGAVLAATGVDISTLIGPEDVRQTLGEYLEWNTSLIKDVSAQTRQRIGNAVFAGLTNRTPARDVAKTIREAVGMGRDRATRIASDQLQKLTSALADERQREAGISQVEWRSSHKRHPRAHHAARDGTIYYLETRTPVEGGEAVPADDWVGRPPYCGCRTRARLTFD